MKLGFNSKDQFVLETKGESRLINRYSDGSWRVSAAYPLDDTSFGYNACISLDDLMEACQKLREDRNV